MIVVTMSCCCSLHRQRSAPVESARAQHGQPITTLGAIVFIFKRVTWRLVGDFTAIGTLVAPVPVLMFCPAFGLSMDHESSCCPE
jgi:hypothetical protein